MISRAALAPEGPGQAVDGSVPARKEKGPRDGVCNAPNRGRTGTHGEKLIEERARHCKKCGLR